MGARQRTEIERTADDVGACTGGPEAEPTRCCTLLTQDSVGEATWIQLLVGTVNMKYRFSDDPLERLRIASVRLPLGTELLEWEATSFATFTIETRSTAELAYFVDRLFVDVLGCDDADYDVRAMIEEIGE